MRLSVVIACRNGAKTLARTLDSIRSMRREDLEVIVADDGSDDDSALVAERAGAAVLRLPKRGRAAALNDGIAAASGEAVLFTDADCLVPPAWADDLEKFLTDGWDGVGGNLVPSSWTAIETAKVLRYLHEFDDDFVLEGAYTRYCLNGNNMAIKKSALDRVGGFDTRFVHGADADLTRRLLDAGFRLLRTRSIQTTHLKVDTLPAFLSTFYTRGSAVRFAMDQGPIPPAVLRRAWLSPFARIFEDYGKLAAMKRLFPGVPAVRLILAPAAHFLADLWAAAGQQAYHRKFSKEAAR